MEFYIVDAFTEKVFGGNPAGVVIIEGGEYPPFHIMLKTAAELRYSETAFVRHIKENEYELRYFTPTDEVDLCGHATIASFSVIGKSGNIKKKNKMFGSEPKKANNFYGCGCYFRYDLDENGLPQVMSESQGKTYVAHTKAGKIEIDVSSNLVMMEMAKPELIKEYNDISDLNEMRNILGLSKKSSLVINPALVSTGLPDILCPVDSLEELNSIDPDFDAMSKLSKREEAVGIHAFFVEVKDESSDSNNSETTKSIQIHCRNFAPLFGIPEEAATGTSNGALTYYLLSKGIIKPDVMNLVEQGNAMGRPSKIFTIATKSDDSSNNDVKIKVGGTAAILAKGQINI